ncbi:DUF7562 family protein [Natronorubrum halophilum]|uniref:DUF7562 family protein n=1 Tax=Natronorubrum halophilum TaxID=1702106 RepID=UPI000EF64429|nr:hypothetical protein [Natronorubrum halophilum]
MWPSTSRTETVTCLACGDRIARSMAREYDKHGDRWDREEKVFEYLCKSCHGDLCHHPRTELEDLLVELDAGNTAREPFLSRYLEAIEERYGTLEEES